MWFDTHTHLSDDCFDELREDIIAKFEAENIGGIIDVGTNFSDSAKAIENAKAHKNIYAACGVHPDYIKHLKPGYQDELLKLLNSHEKVVALGEIGLDYHYDEDPREYQRAKMIEQMEVAKEANKPVIIHDRDSHKDCLDIAKMFKGEVIGVFHSFSGSLEMAKELFNLGYYISISGVITFKNEKKLKEMASKLPLDRILVETDSPCLAPVPFRGKMNMPLYVKHTGQAVALHSGNSVETIMEATFNNAKRLFNIGE